MTAERYIVESDGEGTWAVVDTLTQLPATARNRVLIRMYRDEAKDASDLLNMIEHWGSQDDVRQANSVAAYSLA